MKSKWLAALAAASLVSAPVLAQTSRALAPVAGASQLEGESELPGWIILAGILIGATVLVIDEEDDDNSASP